MIFFALFFLCIVFLIIFGYTWQRLHRSMHVVTTAGTKTPNDYSMSFEDVAFTSKDFVQLSGWYIAVKNPKAIVILVHGRAIKNGGKSMMLPLAAHLYKNNYATLLFDMRGYGKSKGNIVGFGSKEWQDVAAAYSYAKSLQENKKIRIGFLGVSLGGTVSLIAAGKEKIGDFVIASTPYATHSSLFAYQVEKERVFPKFIFQWALQLAANIEMGFGYELYNALSFIQRIQAPLFLIAAKKDALVNPKDAWTLYEKAIQPKEYWEADAGHDVFGQLEDEFVAKVLHFLTVYAE